jgi:hypothetical protein
LLGVLKEGKSAATKCNEEISNTFSFRNLCYLLNNNKNDDDINDINININNKRRGVRVWRVRL